MRDLLLGFDFGGTKLTAVLMSQTTLYQGSRTWLNHQRVFSPVGADAQYDIRTMIRLGREMLRGRAVAAVGVSFGGPVDYETGVVRLSHHVLGWENVPLQAMLAEAFNTAVAVDNDANVAALGEYYYGVGQEHEHLMYITVSTGVGGGWILNGRPWRGHEGMAGEIGHTVVDPNAPYCLCGKRGCVERLASGPYMAQDVEVALYGNSQGRLSGKDIAKMASEGNTTALTILKRGAAALGMGIGHAANFINPSLFVLGGGVTKSGTLWWSEVRTVAHQTALPEVRFQIVPAAFGDDAPLWGTMALAQLKIAS